MTIQIRELQPDRIQTHDKAELYDMLTGQEHEHVFVETHRREGWGGQIVHSRCACGMEKVEA